MHLTESMDLDRPPALVFPFVADLDRYPSWMRLVHRADPEPGSDPAAWSCELRAKVGPFARSKRLRMIRSEYEEDRVVAFERAETDGRTHARWAMRVTTTPTESTPTESTPTESTPTESTPTGSTSSDSTSPESTSNRSGTNLKIELIYDGQLWTGGVLDRILDDEVKRGRRSLERAVEALPDTADDQQPARTTEK